MKSVKSLYQILWATESWFKVLKCQIWLANTKQFFWESKANVETLQKPSPYISASYKFILMSVKSLNLILWASEYWLKALKCQIWLTNTKPFFWESEVNVETLQKPFYYIWVFYKFVLKFGMLLIWLSLLLFHMFWMWNIQLSNSKVNNNNLSKVVSGVVIWTFLYLTKSFFFRAVVTFKWFYQSRLQKWEYCQRWEKVKYLFWII